MQPEISQAQLYRANQESPSSWFVARYPEAYRAHGSPFVEVAGDQIIPAIINYDFMACALGGRKDLGHHVVYLESELAWYFKDGQVFHTTTAEKLMVQYRALMMKCAQEMPPNVCILNLVNEWCSEKVCKTIITRAKTILSAGPKFFSTHQRIQGPELHERLLHALVDSMLQPNPDSILTVTQAYEVFCRLAQRKGLGMLKRSKFKAEMKDLVRQAYSVSLRHDVKDAFGKDQQGWRGLRLVET